ncbi:hypothetical protein C8J25_11115 [Sphingomonas faeni]|uniref:Uncharacterized protein n=1 Tax=Sphingomonas faeni TaxID=185950 RepID=A0A2T5TY92_9SPHN|nr:hypothetical protein C8J25_11115 [Sphingomonas faeni]
MFSIKNNILPVCRMVKFIFNVLNDVKTTADKERWDLSNVRAAYQHARKVIVEVMTE